MGTTWIVDELMISLTSGKQFGLDVLELESVTIPTGNGSKKHGSSSPAGYGPYKRPSLPQPTVNLNIGSAGFHSQFSSEPTPNLSNQQATVPSQFTTKQAPNLNVPAASGSQFPSGPTPGNGPQNSTPNFN
ncbi:hypothetical protein MJO28_009704 [Puccinia striiformis f. sp. tritici]|uniref:Uncharacterized protein n=1 Tax=Puccinia striiformis f. sp. tritici TaxID=168172 RepID=A0ACC0E8D3_9BASI|nr:hypothetical protein MJO28_009704 [Puccinia striiformis f. sp. tritici]